MNGGSFLHTFILIEQETDTLSHAQALSIAMYHVPVCMFKSFSHLRKHTVAKTSRTSQQYIFFYRGCCVLFRVLAIYQRFYYNYRVIVYFIEFAGIYN